MGTDGIRIHAVKVGNRIAALQPIAQRLPAEFGAAGANAGKGPKLRRDHGTQCIADDFLKQIGFWGINTSFAFVAEPQTNGVAERFNRTLKEQAIQGRLFRNLEDVRQAVTELGDRYNQLRAVQGWAPRLKNRDEFLGRYVGLT